MKRQMRGFLHRAERNKANLVRLAHFLKRPANARITRQSLPAIGRPFKGSNDDGHREVPLGASDRPRGYGAGVVASAASAAWAFTTVVCLANTLSVNTRCTSGSRSAQQSSTMMIR